MKNKVVMFSFIVRLLPILFFVSQVLAGGPVGGSDCGFAPAGINFSNTFELPKGRNGALAISESDLVRVRAVGFQTIRLPVAWAEYASTTAPYLIDDEIFKKVDVVIQLALLNDFFVVLDFHGFKEGSLEGDSQLDRFVSIWKQIAEHYKTSSDKVVFELINEPSGALTASVLSRWEGAAIREIRKTNPSRVIVVTGSYWGKVEGLRGFIIPSDDNLVLSIHYYAPSKFTHQGAKWIPGAEKWIGTSWEGSKEELERIRKDLDFLREWRQHNKVKSVFVGEFGVVRGASNDSRRRWISAVRKEIERHGWCWAYWEYKAGFGVYDEKNKSWDVDILDALIPGAGASSLK